MGNVTHPEQICQSFLDYFVNKGHTHLSSAPLVPKDDDSLLFTNSGMVPFKKVFTGEKPPPAPRVVTVQKCLRHNDLLNVGLTGRHHTFFEMLGNFSFGDYHKEEAIVHAWEVLTKVFEIPADRLSVSIHEGDEETEKLWWKVTGLPQHHLDTTEDNFWSMGDTGPCGPCTEIFYDQGNVKRSGDRFLEIWNLVFMESDRQEDGSLVPLPMKSVDTGMGFERITAVLNGVQDNYATPLFNEIIGHWGGPREVSESEGYFRNLRILADHIRAICFLLAEGVFPSNRLQGYVLRRLLRRALRCVSEVISMNDGLYAYSLTELAGRFIDQQQGIYAELGDNRDKIINEIAEEGCMFGESLKRGTKILMSHLGHLSADEPLSGEFAFRLHDTYGFPFELTQDIAREEGKEVSIDTFNLEMERQRDRSRADREGKNER